MDQQRSDPAQTMRLISDLPAIEGQIGQALARFESRLREQEDLLASFICGEAGTGRKHRFAWMQQKPLVDEGQV